LQGWTLDDYKRHVDLYDNHGIELQKLKTVGVGSVCRRQSTKEVAKIIHTLYNFKLRLHGFGFKLGGLALVGDQLASSDSLAWSFGARRMQKRWCKTGNHKNCANCIEYALFWREQILAVIAKKVTNENLLIDIENGIIIKPLVKLSGTVNLKLLQKEIRCHC